MTDRLIKHAALHKIKTQFPNSPEGNLCFAVVAQAVRDATQPMPKKPEEIIKWRHETKSAKDYLSNEIFYAEICGVNSLWIQRVLKESSIL